MTKQEKINKQDRLKQVIHEAIEPYLVRAILGGYETAILEALSKEGVVIKVDRELPCPECGGKKIIYGEPEKWQSLHLCPTCKGNKFVAVEPLIKETIGGYNGA